MASAKQEQIYNEIVQYYSFADSLLKTVEETNLQEAHKQFDIVEDAISKLEDCADKLAMQYIEFVKKGESREIIEIIRAALNEISVKIQECRSKTLMLYR
jgi:hypothetical protein